MVLSDSRPTKSLTIGTIVLTNYQHWRDGQKCYFALCMLKINEKRTKQKPLVMRNAKTVHHSV